jgi:hypothetical protein
MATRAGLFRAWCSQAWRCVLQTAQAVAGYDLTGQRTGGWPPQCPDVPVEWAQYALIAVPDAQWTLDPSGWASCTRWAHEPQAVMTEATQHSATERLLEFTPAEQARLRVLRDRYRADRTRLTGRELAHLQFVRWLHQTGRLCHISTPDSRCEAERQR